MTQQNTYQPAILAAIDGEIGAVQTEYKAALATAGAHLQAAQSSSRGALGAGGGGVLVEAAPELEPELAVALHKFETRLDQLKELRDWVKIDPELAHFVARLDATRGAAPSSSATPGPDVTPTPAPRRGGVPAALVVVVSILALAIGWLLSIALPAASLLPH